MGKAKDLTGMKFGRLTVIGLNIEESSKPRGKNGEKRKYWDCQCECGNITKPISGNSLTSGNTQSCGCLRKERLGELNEKRWENEEFRNRMSDKAREQMRETWKDEEYRQMQSDKMRETWQDEERRQKQSDKMREIAKKNWQDEEMKWKMGYKGGISPISTYLRMLPVIGQWRKDTYEQANYKCQLTGKKVHGGNSEVHHLYGFNMIVQDAHNTYNIQIKEQIKDYTEEELKLLKDYVAEWHKDNSNAVLLSIEAHDLFHQEYGQGSNTPEQYEEFKQRYLNGEFNN